MSKLNLPFRYEYSYLGGYDCMSDSFDILDSKGNRICEIDFASFTLLDGDECKKHCEGLAKFIVDSCNNTKINESEKGK